MVIDISANEFSWKACFHTKSQVSKSIIHAEDKNAALAFGTVDKLSRGQGICCKIDCNIKTSVMQNSRCLNKQ